MTDQTHTHDKTRRQIEPGTSRPVEPGPSRRALLAGVGAAIVAAAGSAAVPAMALESIESVTDAVDRLTRELSEVLDEYQSGEYFALVAGGGMISLQPQSRYRLFRKPLDARHRLELAAKEFQAAYEAVHADVEDWLASRDDATNLRLMVPLWSGEAA